MTSTHPSRTGNGGSGPTAGGRHSSSATTPSAPLRPERPFSDEGHPRSCESSHRPRRGFSPGQAGHHGRRFSRSYPTLVQRLRAAPEPEASPGPSGTEDLACRLGDSRQRPVGTHAVVFGRLRHRGGGSLADPEKGVARGPRVARPRTHPKPVGRPGMRRSPRTPGPRRGTRDGVHAGQGCTTPVTRGERTPDRSRSPADGRLRPADRGFSSGHQPDSSDQTQSGPSPDSTKIVIRGLLRVPVVHCLSIP